MIPTLEDIIRGLLAGTMTQAQAQHYLDAHLQLQAELFGDALPDVPYARAQCLADVIKKCHEQDKRWGPRSYPSFHPSLLADADTGCFQLANYHGIINPRRARLETAAQDGEGLLSWMTILMEEVSKTTEKETRPALREQLIDVAGVAVQWAAQLTPEPQVEVNLVANADDTMSVVASIQEADHEGPNLR